METDEDAEPTITITEADARVAAFRQLASDAVLENHMNSRSCKCDSEIIEALPASDAALKVVVAQAKMDEAKRAPHEQCLAFNFDLTPTGLECSCRRGKRVAFLGAELAATKRDLEAQR